MDEISARNVLGVDPGANAAQIHQAYRAKAKVAHPDAHGNQTAFVALKAAFDLLYPEAKARQARQSRLAARHRFEMPPSGGLASGAWTGATPADPRARRVLDLTDTPPRHANRVSGRPAGSSSSPGAAGCPAGSDQRAQQFEQLLQAHLR